MTRRVPLLFLALIGLAVPPRGVPAEISATFGVGSNYVWRGETRTDDGPAVFGTVDYAPATGLYAGGRTFNIEEDGEKEYEIDAWAGFRFPVGAVKADLGAITYRFPRGDRINRETGRLIDGTENDSDFTELYAKLKVWRFTLGYYRTDDYFGSGEVAHYHVIDYRQGFSPDFSFGLHYGLKDSDAVPDHDGTVFDFGASLEKGPLRFELTNLDDNEDGLQSDNPRFAVYWQHAVNF